MRILILDSESNAALAVTQSLGRGGHACYVAGTRSKAVAARSRYASARLTYPDPLASKRTFQDWLRAIHERERFDLILPCTEATLIPACEIAPGSHVLDTMVLPPPAALARTLDKDACVRLAAEHGLRVPPSLSIAADALDAVDASAMKFPLVLKPVRSKLWVGDTGTNLHARIVNSALHLRKELDHLRGICAVQIQEWVPGRGIGVEVLCDRGTLAASFAHERLHEYPLTGGGSTYRGSFPVPADILTRVGAMMATLQWHGVAMVEFRHDPGRDEWWFMEINPRFWGSLPLPIAAGVDFPAGVVALAQQRRPSLGAPRPGIRARNFAADLTWMRQRAMTRGQAAAGLPGLTRSAVEWLRPLLGREVWDGASWRDPAPIASEVATGLMREARTIASGVRRRMRWPACATHNRAALAAIPDPNAIHVVCSGNICRSPYAAARLRQLLPPSIRVSSAGIRATAGTPPPPLLVRVARERGVDVADHMAVQAHMDAEAEPTRRLVIVFDRVGARALVRTDNRITREMVWLGALDPECRDAEVTDPYGRSVQEIGAILARIDRCCEALVSRLRID